MVPVPLVTANDRRRWAPSVKIPLPVRTTMASLTGCVWGAAKPLGSMVTWAHVAVRATDLLGHADSVRHSGQHLPRNDVGEAPKPEGHTHPSTYARVSCTLRNFGTPRRLPLLSAPWVSGRGLEVLTSHGRAP